MERELYYKSMRTCPDNEHWGTVSYDPNTGKNVACQTLGEILESGSIIPNTVHSRLPKRLCVSRLDDGYPGVYRPAGLVFATQEKPSICVPFDLMALTNEKNLETIDYNSEFLADYKQFLFGNFEEMKKRFPDSKKAADALNQFRRDHNLPEIPESKINYNEECFLGNSPLEIKPVALIGDSHELKELSKEYQTELYPNAESYLRCNDVKQQRKNNFRIRLAKFAEKGILTASLASWLGLMYVACSFEDKPTETKENKGFIERALTDPMYYIPPDGSPPPFCG